MESFGKVIGINLGLLLLYSLLIRTVAGTESGKGETILIMSMMAIILHVVALLITGIALYIAAKTKLAHSVMLSAVITLVVGFGVCWGNASI